MRRPALFFILIATLAAGLMVLIGVAQIITQQNIERSKQGNKRSALTFSINNRLQGMVNLAFELETKISREESRLLVMPGRRFRDSLNILGYNTTALKQMWPDSAESARLNDLVSLINGQVDLSFALLDATEEKNSTLQKKISDSLKNNSWNPKIYAAAVAFQKAAELKLENTLQQTNTALSRASNVSRLLAGVALLAIGLLATIIIRRQVKQLALIKDLEAARKSALESAKAKDQFLANMSHEIRTPLNAIKGFGKILLQTPLNADQHKYTAIIANASDNLLNIVNDILDFSKIESGNIILANSPFNLHQQLTEVQNMFAALAEEKSLKLLVTKTEEVPEYVNGDAQRLRQIFVNLISNAIKFTNEGKVQLHASVIKEGHGKTTLLFQVSDTGIGIPKDKLNLIFDRFEQVDDSYSRQQGGTGLGLAITKWLAEAMGGKIIVKSEPGKGSVFNVEISFTKAPQGYSPAEAKEVLTGQALDLLNKAILVADDNKLNQLLVKNILDKHGISSIPANSGEEAIALLGDQQPDLVLMDIQMPGLDGLTATGIIRNRLKSNVPVVAMTAHVLAGERDKCISAGMNDYISKPLDENEFLRVLKKYLSPGPPAAKIKETFAEDEWLNMPYLKSVCNGNWEKAKIILMALQEGLGREISGLRKVAEEKNYDNLKKAIHSLRSTLTPVKNDAPPFVFLEKIAEKTVTGAGIEEMTGEIQSLVTSAEELGNKIHLLLQQ